ncbi:MAG TPA: XisI protein [Anaerolineae bacterium]|nr:XisI protein [Anaerolineae bacterium]
MDRLDTYRRIIKQLLSEHARYHPSDGNVQTITIVDVSSDNYLVMDIGWNATGRVHSVILHLRLHDNKIWIEWDGTEQGIAEELVKAGVSKDDIVLAFYRPERRALTEFAVA